MLVLMLALISVLLVFVFVLVLLLDAMVVFLGDGTYGSEFDDTNLGCGGKNCGSVAYTSLRVCGANGGNVTVG